MGNQEEAAAFSLEARETTGEKKKNWRHRFPEGETRKRRMDIGGCIRLNTH